MRTLKYKDYVNSCVFTEEMLDLFLAILKLDLIKIQSDFSGNLFYVENHASFTSTKPLNICIPELKAEPVEGGSK